MTLPGIIQRLMLAALLSLSLGTWAQRPPAPPVAVPAAKAPPSAWRQAELQVALDRQSYSPGCIDNRAGSQTRAALAAWQCAHELPETGTYDEATAAVLKLDVPAFIEYEITAGDLAQLGAAPDDWRARAVLKQLSYETAMELVAEKFHATQRLIGELNPQVNLARLTAPAKVRVPNVLVDTALPKASQVRINLAAKSVMVFNKAGLPCAFFPCSIGRDKMKRPVGDLRIADVAPHPNYTFDPKVFPESPEAQAIGKRLIIPPGPNNPVGVMWLCIGRAPDSTEPPLTGYGIHGTPKPEDIGRTESHGCFRLANWNVERLGAMVSIGTPVVVEAQ